jgi:hypothetical protein
MLTEPSVALIVPLALIALAPDREAHLLQDAHVAHAGIDDQRPGAARHEAGGQQVAEVAVGAIGGDGGHHDVAGLDLLGGDVHHPVVAGCSSTVTAVPATSAPDRSAACKA